jgi:hypothetical protein
VKSTSSAVRVDDWQKGNVPQEAIAPLFNIAKGEVVVVSTKDGDLAVRVKSVQAGSEKDIEESKPKVKGHLQQEWLALHLDELDGALRNTFPVKVDERGLQRMVQETNQ